MSLVVYNQDLRHNSLCALTLRYATVQSGSRFFTVRIVPLCSLQSDCHDASACANTCQSMSTSAVWLVATGVHSNPSLSHPFVGCLFSPSLTTARHRTACLRVYTARTHKEAYVSEVLSIALCRSHGVIEFRPSPDLRFSPFSCPLTRASAAVCSFLISFLVLGFVTPIVLQLPVLRRRPVCSWLVCTTYGPRAAHCPSAYELVSKKWCFRAQTHQV